MKRRKIISIEVTSGRYKAFVDEIIASAKREKSSYVCVANVHMTIEAYDNNEFAGKVNRASIVTPDGMPLVKMFRYLYGERQERVAGMDLMPDLIKSAAEENVSVYFYGSTEEIVGSVRKRAEELFPNLKIAGVFSPPFRELTEEERKSVTERINNSGAGLIFVSLGCPKQERWMSEMTDEINGVMVGVGGAFQIFAGIKKRAPVWMQKLSLEWLFRLLGDPVRLWKRYLYTNSKFIVLAAWEIFKKRILRINIEK